MLRDRTDGERCAYFNGVYRWCQFAARMLAVFRPLSPLAMVDKLGQGAQHNSQRLNKVEPLRDVATVCTRGSGTKKSVG